MTHSRPSTDGAAVPARQICRRAQREPQLIDRPLGRVRARMPRLACGREFLAASYWTNGYAKRMTLSTAADRSLRTAAPNRARPPVRRAPHGISLRQIAVARSRPGRRTVEIAAVSTGASTSLRARAVRRLWHRSACTPIVRQTVGGAAPEPPHRCGGVILLVAFAPLVSPGRDRRVRGVDGRAEVVSRAGETTRWQCAGCADEHGVQVEAARYEVGDPAAGSRPGVRAVGDDEQLGAC